MNLKYLVSLLAVASLVACSDDDSSPSAVSPSNLQAASSSDAALVPASAADPLLASSSSVMDPAQVPASSADPGVAPASSSAIPAASGTSTALDLSKVQLYGCELTGLEQFKYGRFEARMKMAAVSGSVSSMFLNYDNSYIKKQEPWNEIDIEILGKSATSWQSNLITREPDTDGKVHQNISSEKIHDLAFDATADFHLYGIVWTPEYIAWEIDSVEVRRDVVGQETNLAHDQVAFMTETQTLRFNLWVSNSPGWTGKFTGEGLPVEQQIDYVRVYSYDEATKGFTFSWQDDFEGNTLDGNRWSRGNWEMEKVMYRPQNVKVRDGHVSIILDYEEM